MMLWEGKLEGMGGPQPYDLHPNKKLHSFRPWRLPIHRLQLSQVFKSIAEITIRSTAEHTASMSIHQDLNPITITSHQAKVEQHSLLTR